MIDDMSVYGLINRLATDIHESENRKWWYDENGNKKDLNIGQNMMLMVTELAEAFEGERKDLMDDKLPQRKNAEVELADCIIRILDYCADKHYDIGGAIKDKRRYNATREDHKKEAMEQPHGKKW